MSRRAPPNNLHIAYKNVVKRNYLSSRDNLRGYKKIKVNIYIYIGSVLDVIVIVTGNEDGDPSSNLE